MAILGDFIATVGFPVAVVVFLLLRDQKRDEQVWNREQRMAERITQLEKDNVERVLPVLERCAAALARAEGREGDRP